MRGVRADADPAKRARQAERPDAARRDRRCCRAWARAPARTGATSTRTARTTTTHAIDAHGRLVAAAGRGRVPAGARRRRRYDALHDDAAARRASLAGDDPAAPDFDDGWWGFVSQGPARPVRTASTSRGRWSRVLLRRRQAKAKCRAALQASLREALRRSTRQQLYGHGDCADDPDAAAASTRTARRSPSAIVGAAVPVPEPADVPADGRADATPAALSGFTMRQWTRSADSSWSQRPRCRTRTSSARSS